MHGVVVTIKDNVLTAASVHHALNKEVTSLFYEPYASLMAEVLRDYLGQNVTSIRVKNMPIFKQAEYVVRGWVQKSTALTNFYFKHFKKREVGHGTLIQ